MAKILVAEDEDLHLTSILHHLISWGHDPKGVKNGLEAIGEIEKGFKPEILILDLIMPVMGGIEMIKHLNEMELDFPLIVITANPDKETLDECLNLGVTEILHKPIEPDELKAEIDDIMIEFGL